MYAIDCQENIAKNGGFACKHGGKNGMQPTGDTHKPPSFEQGHSHRGNLDESEILVTIRLVSKSKRHRLCVVSQLGWRENRNLPHRSYRSLIDKRELQQRRWRVLTEGPTGDTVRLDQRDFHRNGHRHITERLLIALANRSNAKPVVALFVLGPLDLYIRSTKRSTGKPRRVSVRFFHELAERPGPKQQVCMFPRPLN